MRSELANSQAETALAGHVQTTT